MNNVRGTVAIFKFRNSGEGKLYQRIMIFSYCFKVGREKKTRNSSINFDHFHTEILKLKAITF